MATDFRLSYPLRKRRTIGWSFVGLVSFWAAYEYLHQSWDLAFPWMTLGNGFANFHEIVQWYSITGVYGGTLWIWGINILLFLLYWQQTQKVYVLPQRRLVLATVAAIVVPVAVSLIQYSSYKEHINPSDIVVVQPNIDPYGKFGFISPEEQVQRLMELSAQVARPNTEFFIWPETAISARGGINEEEFRSYPIYQSIVDFLGNYRNGNVLSGIESYALFSEQQTRTARPFAGQYVDSYNAAVLIDGSSKLQFYHKSKLVPGVEQMPFGGVLEFMKPLFKHFGGTTGGYGRDTEPSVFYAQSGIGAAPVICYESIWGNYVRQYVQKGAQFIAVVTNDGWWEDTSGKDQHLDYARLRAIENRRWVVRSANTGISGFINQRGDIVQRTEWWVPAALHQEINLNEELTMYMRIGDVVVYLALLGGVLSLFSLLLPITKLK